MVLFGVKFKNPIISFLAVAFCFLLTTGIAQAALEADLGDGNRLQLYGIGTHQELRNDIYVGALLVPPGVETLSQIKDPNVAKRMSFRFISRYSQRQVTRMFKQRLAMNNPRSKWQPLTKEIKQFSSIFKRPLQPADEINIDYLPGKGVFVYLNKTKFVQIASPDFMNLLLNIWLGNVPPTKAFKAGITGKISRSEISDFEARYLALEPIAGRFDADLKPVATVASVEPAKTEKKPAKTQAKKKPVKKKNNTTKPTKKNTQKQVPKQAPKKASQKTADKTPVSKKPGTKVVQTKPVVSPPSSDKAKSNNKVVANDKKTTTAEKDKKPVQVAKIEKPKSIQPEPITQPEEDDGIDADLLAGSYSRELIDAVRAKQFYPRKAQIKGEEGSVRALVKIDQNGEIISSELIERSGSRELDRAVQKMIRRAEPYPAIPPEMGQETWEFEVPISFNMARE